jgi:DNA polymerase (family 10)
MCIWLIIKVGILQEGLVDNQQIVNILNEMARGLEFLDENPFKVRAYRKAAQSIETLDISVSELVAQGKISRIHGVGKAIAAKIEAWDKYGDFTALEEIRSQTPQGLDELLKVPGLGPKRIKSLYQDLGINTIDELSAAGKQGRLSVIKGFSDKSIIKFQKAIEKVISYRGKYLIDISLGYAKEIRDKLMDHGIRAELTGECRRTLEVISRVDVLVENDPSIEKTIQSCFGKACRDNEQNIILDNPEKKMPPVMFHLADKQEYPFRQFLSTGSKEHIDFMKGRARQKGFLLNEDGIFVKDQRLEIKDEKDIYRAVGIPYMPPEIREAIITDYYAPEYTIPELLQNKDMRGTLHNHSTFSDGKTSLRELVFKAREMGYDWIGISDHSMSAYYAGGMSIDDVRMQHNEIDELNRSPEGITILKGIESEILRDGSLDYPPEVLAEFDFVIASIHSHMDMNQDRMTQRIVRAVKNPYTSILAHPCGRLLLSREAYEVDMDAVLKEALHNRVAIELNANPMRLDIDWRLIPGFISSGGKIAIGPDAHSAQGLGDMDYGVMMARKGLLTPDKCLNTLDVDKIRSEFAHR